MDSQVADARGRALRDLRVSVTDRCNFRCPYCMPRDVFGPDFAFLPREELLTFEEITRIAGSAARLGVHKLRLTGGEPLLRRDLPVLVGMVAAIAGIDDVALTTNGSLLEAQAAALHDAGLTRLTVSLDSLDDAVFKRMSDTRIPVQRVLDGIAAAQAAGFGPVKVNTVVRRGVNDDAIEDLAAWARREGLVIRFIEYMDVGSTNGWERRDVVPSADVVARITRRWTASPVIPGNDALRPDAAAASPAQSDVAERWRYHDGGGEFGVISSVTAPFCSTCVRARLSAVGELFTCLFATTGHDLRGLLRGGGSDADLDARLAAIWGRRTDRYSELRARGGATPARKVEMSYIGG